MSMVDDTPSDAAFSVCLCGSLSFKVDLLDRSSFLDVDLFVFCFILSIRRKLLLFRVVLR